MCWGGEGMGDMGAVEEGNRLLSGCLLLLRHIIPIFNVNICIIWGSENLMFKKQIEKNMTRKSCSKNIQHM